MWGFGWSGWGIGLVVGRRGGERGKAWLGVGAGVGLLDGFVACGGMRRIGKRETEKELKDTMVVCG